MLIYFAIYKKEELYEENKILIKCEDCEKVLFYGNSF